ncbi:unnamed protein product [Parnassius apollo]|uniref:(apollo) hypothetical protein n=1 Tax=Parnassius apollo TaxID=110799 RepID=A0A8S3X576_PARAO|nr:unnamed protein product [Parnassius apollo]
MFSSLVCVEGQAYEDKRCRCVCPSPAEVLNSSLSKDRKLFTDYVPPNKCNCYGVILPRMGEEIIARAQEFCPRCECKYETRNTTIIMVVVIMVLWVLMLLTVYLLFLMCLDPLINKRRVKQYMERDTEEARNLLLNEEVE